MRGLIKKQLLNNKITQIENFNLDTYANDKLFFSHRRSAHFDDLPTGRMINIIGFTRKKWSYLSLDLWNFLYNE